MRDCRGCGTRIDPDQHPDGLCDECERENYQRNREPPGWRA